MIYVYNGKVYKSRIPLLGKTVRLWFHDDYFSKLDWTKEPTESLDELYKQRALWLRQHYDHLILMYSGGADSHQVLHSFIDNGIHLDEVHTFFPLKMMNAIAQTEYPEGYNLTLLKEYNEAVIPRFAKLSITHPRIKIKVWDISDFISDNRISDKFLEDNKAVFGANTKYNGIKSVFQMLQIRDYVEKLPGKIAVIYGADRPNFVMIDGYVHFFFSDLGRSSVGGYDSSILNYDAILFYWEPEASSIILKQSHLMKRFMEKVRVMPLKDSYIMKKLIYPSTYEPQIYQQPIPDKYTNEQILLYFFTNEKENIAELHSIRMKAMSKYYKVG